MSSTLEQKYPFISFLSWMQEPFELCQQRKVVSLSDFLAQLLPKLALVVGLDLCISSDQVIHWLEQDRSRRLVFFEKKPEEVLDFLKVEKKLLLHPQVDLKFLSEDQDLIQTLVAQVASYPADQVQILLSTSYEKIDEDKSLKLEVFRKATLITSWFHEKAWYHYLCDNLFPNFQKLSCAFDADSWNNIFANVPAIICGAGPSLERQALHLQKIQHQALILAGGSTLSALSHLQITPHIGFALDPNPEEHQRLQKAYGSTYPLLFGARLEKKVLDHWKGPIGYMHTSSGGFLEQHLQQQMLLESAPLLKGLSAEALSVTTMALSAAVSMGCNPIYLVGVDLAYIDDKRYAGGVIEEQQNQKHQDLSASCVSEKVNTFNRDNKPIETTIKWIMEKDAIEDFARNHPHIQIFDCFDGGLGFDSLPKQQLQDLQQLPCMNPKKLVEQAVAQAPLCLKDPKIMQTFFSDLEKTLRASLELVEKLVLFCKEHPGQDPEMSALGTLWKMDLEKESSYTWLLEPLEEYSSALFQSPYDKWYHYQELLKTYLQKL